jgi:hypothetical protein
MYRRDPTSTGGPGSSGKSYCLFIIEATRYKVLPIDDRLFEKINPDTAGRPV